MKKVVVQIGKRRGARKGSLDVLSCLLLLEKLRGLTQGLLHGAYVTSGLVPVREDEARLRSFTRQHRRNRLCRFALLHQRPFTFRSQHARPYPYPDLGPLQVHSQRKQAVRLLQLQKLFVHPS
jgi:hypothetical protein